MSMVSLDQIAIIKRGSAPKNVQVVPTSDATIPVFGGGGIYGYTNIASHPSGTLITGGIGTLGRLFRAPEPCHPNNNTLVITPRDPNYSKNYFYYAILNRIRDVIDLNVGSASPYVTPEHVGSLRLEFNPDLKSIQIADFLEDVDKKIEVNRQISSTLEEMARALFKSWFVDFDPIHAKAAGQAPAHMDAATAALFPDGFDDDGLPDQWTHGRATDLIEFNPREPLKKGATAPYLDMKALPTLGACAEPPVMRVFTSGTRFRAGDVLLARITPCLENGKTALVDNLPDGSVGWGSTEFIVMRGQNGASPGFVYCLVRLQEFRNCAIQSMVGSSGRQRVQQERLEDFSVAIPPVGILDAFSRLTNPMFAAISANGKQNETLGQLRDTLLPKLMSGELRVHDAERQVAEVA